MFKQRERERPTSWSEFRGDVEQLPTGAQGLHVRPSGAGYPLGLSFPTWYYRETGRAPLARAIERGGEFADFLQYEIDPELTKEAKAKYRIETKLKGQVGKTDIEFIGFRDLAIYDGNTKTTVDFKMWGRQWDEATMEREWRKHLDQVSHYHYADPGGKLAITYADPATKEAVERAFRNNEITADQAIEELATESRDWITPHMRKAAPGVKRVKTFSTDKPVEEREIEDYSVVTQRFQYAVKQMIEITGYQLTNKLSNIKRGPTPELMPLYRGSLEAIDEIAFRFATGKIDEAGVEQSFGLVVREAERAGYLNVKGDLRNADTVIQQAWDKQDRAVLEQQEVRGFTRLRGQGWEPLDDTDPDYSNVLVNHHLGRIAITHPTPGGGRPSVFWEGTYGEVVDPDGNPVQIINGRALVKQQATGTRDKPSVEFVMPDVFRNTQRAIKTSGGGDAAARKLTALMTGNLSGLPSVRPGSSTSARLAVLSTMMTTQGGHSVQAQQEALGRDLVLRGSSRQARSLSTLIQSTLGWAVDRATGMAFAGFKKGREGKLGKRAQQGQREELIRSDDPSRTRFFPFIQPGTEQYGPELGERFQIAMPFRPFMPEGIGHVSERVAGQHRWQQIERSVDIDGSVDLLPSSGQVQSTRKGFRLGVLQGDVNRELFDPNLEKWDVLEMLGEPGVTRMGSKTRVTYQARVGTRIGSGQGKLWGPGIKAMLAVARLSAMARGDAATADMILPTPKNIRQFAASVVGYEYARPGGEEDLLGQIYGEKAEKTPESWYNLTEAQRGRYAEEGYGPGDIPTGMPFMPTSIRDQVRFFKTAVWLIARGIQGHGTEKYIQPVNKTQYELFRRAGMPMQILDPNTLEYDDKARLPGGYLVEIESPGFLGGFLGQIGREFQGQARLSLEESTSMYASLGYGEDYRKAVREKIMPHLAKLSGHTRQMYLQVSKANMFNEAALRPGENEYIDLSEITSGSGAVTGWKDTRDFLNQLAKKTGNRFIRVGDKYYPSGEAFSTMHVPEAWRVMVPYGDEEEEERENVPEQDITRIINALEGVIISGADSPKLDVLHQALYDKETGLAYTRAVAKGSTSMLLPHGGVENVALSYSGIPDGVTVMGPAALQDMFGTSDYGLVTEWLNEGNRYAAGLRRPDYMGKEPTPLLVVNPQEAREKLGLRHIPDTFGGVAISPIFMGMQTGDLDGDRIMALLLATSKQGKQGRKWETDPAVRAAASEQVLLGKWTTMLANQLNTTPEELGIDPTNVTMDDWFTLHEMMGPDLSEVQKRLRDIQGAELAIGEAREGPLGLAGVLFPGGLDPEEGQIFSRSPLAEIRRKYFEEPLAKQHLQFSFNQFRRQMPEYMAQAGITGFDRMADIMKFRAPQHAVDIRMLSRGLIEMLNLSAGYDPATIAKENYKKALWRPGYRRDPERLSLVGRGNNFQERLIQSVLDSRELWSIEAEEDEALFRTERVAKDIASAISADGGMQSRIAEHLMTSKSVSGASIYSLFGGDDTERLRSFWHTPGAPVGTVGAQVFGKGLRTAGGASRTLAQGKLSAGQLRRLGLRPSDTEKIARHMANLTNVQARWTQLESVPEIKKLAEMSGALTAAVAVPSGRGGRWLLENLARFGGVPGVKQVMGMLWGGEFDPEDLATVVPGIRSFAEGSKPDTTLATLNDDEVRLLDAMKATGTPSKKLADLTIKQSITARSLASAIEQSGYSLVRRGQGIPSEVLGAWEQPEREHRLYSASIVPEGEFGETCGVGGKAPLWKINLREDAALKAMWTEDIWGYEDPDIPMHSMEIIEKAVRTGSMPAPFSGTIREFMQEWERGKQEAWAPYNEVKYDPRDVESVELVQGTYQFGRGSRKWTPETWEPWERPIPSYAYTEGELTEEELSGLFGPGTPSRPIGQQITGEQPQSPEYEQAAGMLFAAAQQFLRMRQEEPRLAREMTPEVIERFAQLGLTMEPGTRTHGQIMQAIEQRYRAGELRPPHMLAGVLRGVPLRSLEPFAGAAGVTKTALGEWATMQRGGRATETIMGVALGEQTRDLAGRFESLIGETDPLIDQMKEMREVYQNLGEAAKTATEEQRVTFGKAQGAIEGFFRSATTLAGRAERGEDYLLQAPGAVRERLGRGMAGLQEGFGALGPGPPGAPPGPGERFGGWLGGFAPSGRGVFSGDLGQLGWTLFNLQRIWRYTGGITTGAAQRYAGYVGGQQQQMAALGIGEGYAGPAADVLAGRATIERAQLGFGQASWQFLAPLVSALGATDARMRPGPAMQIGAAALPSLGVPLTLAMGGGFLARQAGMMVSGAAQGLTGPAAAAARQAAMGTSAYRIMHGGAGAMGLLSQAAVTVGAPVLGAYAGGAIAPEVAEMLGREEQAEEMREAGPWGTAREALGAGFRAFQIPTLAAAGWLQRRTEGGPLGGITGRYARWLAGASTQVAGGIEGREEAPELSPEQQAWQDTIDRLASTPGVTAGPEAIGEAAYQYAQATGMTPGSAGWSDENVLRWARMAPGALQQVTQGAAQYALAAGEEFGTTGFEEIVGGFRGTPTELRERARISGVLAPLQQRRQAMGLDLRRRDLTGMTQQQAYDLAQREQRELGLTEQLTGMGAGAGAAEQAAEALGGAAGIRGFQGLLGGDPWAVSRFAQGNMNVFDPNAPAAARTRTAAARLFGGEIPPEVAELMDNLKPIIDTQTGLKVGIASFPGFSEQLAEGLAIAAGDPGAPGAIALPGAAGVPGWVQEIIEERGTRGLQVEQTQIQRGYQEWQWGQREQALDWQRVSQFGGQFSSRAGDISTRGTFAIQRELRNLSRIWEDFTTDYQEQQRQVQFAQFMENWGVRAERAPVGFQWQREDLAFRGAQQTMQYGWGMEDIQESLRYATGRERRQLLRQQERATIQYGMGMGQLGVQGERIDIREQWSQEDLEREKRHFLERFALQDEYQSRYRWYTEQRRALEDELQAIHEYGAMFNLEQAELALAKQQEIAEQINAINDGYLATNVLMTDNAAAAVAFAQATALAMVNMEGLLTRLSTFISVYDSKFWYAP